MLEVISELIFEDFVSLLSEDIMFELELNISLSPIISDETFCKPEVISLLFVLDSDINSELFSNVLIFVYDLSLVNIELSDWFDSSKLVFVSVNLFSVDIISELIFVDSIDDDISFFPDLVIISDEISELENTSLLFIIDSDINSEVWILSEEDSYVISNSLSVDDIDV